MPPAFKQEFNLDCLPKIVNITIEVTGCYHLKANLFWRILGKWWTLFFDFTHVIRRPCWCQYNRKIVAQGLHDNIVKFPKEFLAIVLTTNMAAGTSSAIKELRDLCTHSYATNLQYTRQLCTTTSR